MSASTASEVSREGWVAANVSQKRRAAKQRLGGCRTLTVAKVVAVFLKLGAHLDGRLGRGDGLGRRGTRLHRRVGGRRRHRGGRRHWDGGRRSRGQGRSGRRDHRGPASLLLPVRRHAGRRAQRDGGGLHGNRDGRGLGVGWHVGCGRRCWHLRVWLRRLHVHGPLRRRVDVCLVPKVFIVKLPLLRARPRPAPGGSEHRGGQLGCGCTIDGTDLDVLLLALDVLQVRLVVQAVAEAAAVGTQRALDGVRDGLLARLQGNRATG